MNSSDEAQLNVDDVKKLLKFVSRGYKVPPVIWDTLFKVAVKEIEEKGKVVMIKRDPNVDRGRIAGSFVKIIEGETLDIHPSVVGQFGADFDGDTMAIFRVLSEEAETEIKQRMISTTQNMHLNAPSFNISKEMLIGLFTMTYLENKNVQRLNVHNINDVFNMDIGQPISIVIKGKRIDTTAGKVIFNTFIPDYFDFINEPVDGKKINKLLSNILVKSSKDYAVTVDNFMKNGFKYATMYPQTISIDMFMIPDSLFKMKEKLDMEKDPGKQQDIINEMEKMLIQYLKDYVPSLYIQVQSGAAKGSSQLRQVMVAKGLLNDAKGNLMPPFSESLALGYSPSTYFEASVGSRKGTIDRSLNTAKGGYAYRKAIFCFGNVTGDVTNADCGTKRFFKLKVTKDLFGRLQGRYVALADRTIEKVSEKHIGKVVNLRSPMYCKSKSICRVCYGDLLYQVKSKNIGIIASQAVLSLSEKVMKCNVGMIEYNNKLYSFEDLWDNSI